MTKVKIILNFLINESYQNKQEVYSVVDYMIDEAWDELFDCGLEPPGFDVEIEEV